MTPHSPRRGIGQASWNLNGTIEIVENVIANDMRCYDECAVEEAGECR